MAKMSKLNLDLGWIPLPPPLHMGQKLCSFFLVGSFTAIVDCHDCCSCQEDITSTDLMADQAQCGESPVQDQSEAISGTKESSPGMPHGGPPGLDYGNPIVARMDWSPGSC